MGVEQQGLFYPRIYSDQISMVQSTKAASGGERPFQNLNSIYAVASANCSPTPLAICVQCVARRVGVFCEPGEHKNDKRGWLIEELFQIYSPVAHGASSEFKAFGALKQLFSRTESAHAQEIAKNADKKGYVFGTEAIRVTKQIAGLYGFPGFQGLRKIYNLLKFVTVTNIFWSNKRQNNDKKTAPKECIAMEDAF